MTNGIPCESSQSIEAIFFQATQGPSGFHLLPRNVDRHQILFCCWTLETTRLLISAEYKDVQDSALKVWRVRIQGFFWRGTNLNSYCQYETIINFLPVESYQLLDCMLHSTSLQESYYTNCWEFPCILYYNRIFPSKQQIYAIEVSTLPASTVKAGLADVFHLLQSCIKDAWSQPNISSSCASFPASVLLLYQNSTVKINHDIQNINFWDFLLNFKKCNFMKFDFVLMYADVSLLWFDSLHVLSLKPWLNASWFIN